MGLGGLEEGVGKGTEREVERGRGGGDYALGCLVQLVCCWRVKMRGQASKRF